MGWDISGLVEAIVMLSAGGWLRVKVRANWQRFLYSFRDPKSKRPTGAILAAGGARLVMVRHG